MKKYYFLFSLTLLSFAAKAQIVNIPDASFKAKLLSSSTANSVARNSNGQTMKIDANSDGEIQVSEALLVYQLNAGGVSAIASVTGLEAFTNIRVLSLRNDNLTTLDVSMLTNLTNLECGLNDNLSSLDVSGLAYLTEIHCDIGNLTSLNLSGLTALTTLSCWQNEITSLQIAGLPNLQSVNCSDNELAVLDLTGLTGLLGLNCSNNHLSSLNTNDSSSITGLNIDGNNFTVFNASVLPWLVSLSCANNNITSLNLDGLANLSSLYCNSNSLSTIDISDLVSLEHLNCENNMLSALDLSANTKIIQLICSGNQLSTLSLTGMGNLWKVWCDHNLLTSLVLADAPISTAGGIDLACNYNLLTSLDFTGWTHGFENLTCSHNQLTSINLAGNPIDTNFDCSYNQMASLDVSGQQTAFLSCNNNLLTYLNISNCPYMEEIDCSNNLLTTLDAGRANAHMLNCNNNQLVSLFLKGGYITFDVDLNDNPNLQYVCVDDDEDELSEVQNSLLIAGNTTCEVNSYCTFTYGAFYTMQGQHKYDMVNDGCDASDSIIPSLKLNITNGTVQGTVFDDESGNYSIRVQAGTHTITPVIPSPYYQISPASVTTTFPGAAVPSIQDFCITSDGDHPDVEVSLFPINTAVPGFDVHYRMRIKNNGTVLASGTLQLMFNGAVMDFLSANPSVSGQTSNVLSWNYTDLPIFGIKEFEFAFTLNTPLDTPPLNLDDVILFTATANLTADEMPADNVATLNQTVFNAIDPNDKTCLEGDTITPQMVGEYVHYKIRFENTGNYPAAIVTVKDVIDTSKFDISTLTPIAGSHHFVTRITNDNQVEFIFENIMLPFDDANNDGYVIFKIKTKPTLVLGDQLSNTAGIYFNYNAPVITNTAVTTVAIPLGIDDENTFGFALYPNPVKDVLNISSKNNATINAVEIYNMLSQEILKVKPASGDNRIDISGLATGNYVVKVLSDGGNWTAKFVKE
ncbi:DUF7619 domain-containing protein [Flavobacterium pallidum]|uniref:T9SS C-terminal target domain-containing protein n=1 Tax=Flavobacterium pallidum TaxID=2172098 RepID=A0A2S1SJK1_9FLAO|nr:T9SS type A sorting domain-containing protein [Flavobacterium pallidum]AWI26522.1 T9SS C-terminal target domain-containing protein [Flavobacterium pallidum]